MIMVALVHETLQSHLLDTSKPESSPRAAQAACQQCYRVQSVQSSITLFSPFNSLYRLNRKIKLMAIVVTTCPGLLCKAENASAICHHQAHNL